MAGNELVEEELVRRFTIIYRLGTYGGRCHASKLRTNIPHLLKTLNNLKQIGILDVMKVGRNYIVVMTGKGWEVYNFIVAAIKVAKGERIEKEVKKREREIITKAVEVAEAELAVPEFVTGNPWISVLVRRGREW